MDILVNVILPLSLAFIMFSLGVGLSLGDFTRVFYRRRAFAIGALCQILLIPVVAYLIIMVFGFTGALAAGIMLVSFCPGGVTSNIVSRLAKGDVALSVSLTAVMSLASIVTIPFLVGWSVVHFMGETAPPISVAKLALAMFILTTVPVALGMGFRKFLGSKAERVEPFLVKIASLLFLLIIIAAVASNWTLFKDNFTGLGLAMATLIIVMMTLGIVISAIANLDWKERKTISIEVGIQNGTLGITLAPIIAGVSSGIPAIGLPSAIYGVFMYLVAIPFVFWMRRR